MDYKEKYESALEIARRKHKIMIEQNSTLAAGLLEEIFPELAESEDERIRKELIGMINECTNWLHKKEYVKYIEKQKENPKNADSIPADCVSDAKCEDRSPKHTDSFGTDIRDTPAYWRGWDDAMKQKEQKHPNGCFTCDEYKKGYEAGRFHGFTAGYNKAMKEQKPAEWSEEDKKKIHFLSRLIELQVKDDEYCFGDDSMVSKQEAIEMLKSLRPHWKPSEEQMGALSWMLENARGNIDFDPLKDLYEQLKKMI